MNRKFVGSKKACEILGVHHQSLHNWDSNKKIEVLRTPGGKRLYNIDKFINDNTTSINDNIDNNKTKRNICYCRVSTKNQKNDLMHQIDFMKEKYPNYEIIKDIGSGLNFKRVGLKKLINYAINGEINTIVIAYKDRLCRFGFDLLEFIIDKYSNGKIIVLNEKHLSPEEELTHDLVSIINVFSARINGLRTYKKKIENLQIDKNDKKT